MREDVFAEPALLALDRETGEVAWQAEDAAGIKSEWANVRSSPAVVGDLLVYGEPYSDRLVAVGIEDGQTRWSVEGGPVLLPSTGPRRRWSAGQVILPRYDGGLYAVALATKTRPGPSTWASRPWTVSSPPSSATTSASRQPQAGASVIASPAVADNGVVIVGHARGLPDGDGRRRVVEPGRRGGRFGLLNSGDSDEQGQR